jgi:hypothetical protein
VEYSDLPAYKEFLVPVLRAVEALGGTAHAKEITEWMVEQLGYSDDAVAVEYPNRPGESVLFDRMAWARSYDKLGGLVETPQRGLYVLSPGASASSRCPTTKRVALSMRWTGRSGGPVPAGSRSRPSRSIGIKNSTPSRSAPSPRRKPTPSI